VRQAHISFKPAVERFEEVVFNEALCIKLAAEAGLPAASVETMKVDGIDCLMVEPYDRIHKEGRAANPPSSDFTRRISVRHRASCLSASINKEGGPSLKQCFGLLREVSSAPVIDLNALARSGDLQLPRR
jgi:serine/threonine-protein kinase HipA